VRYGLNVFGKAAKKSWSQPKDLLANGSIQVVAGGLAVVECASSAPAHSYGVLRVGCTRIVVAHVRVWKDLAVIGTFIIIRGSARVRGRFVALWKVTKGASRKFGGELALAGACGKIGTIVAGQW
jgi:hypothetical protein